MGLNETYQALLKAKRPISFFGKVSNAEELKSQYKAYAKKIHPDKVQEQEKYIASEAFSILNRLYKLGLEELEEGCYELVQPAQFYKNKEPLFALEVAGKQYQFYECVFEGEVAYLFRGLEKDNVIYLKLAMDPQDNELIQTEYDVLSRVQHQSLPYVEQKLKINGVQGFIMREIEGITMLELLEEYSRGIPATHVMWMLERLFSVVGFLHSNCVVHGNIKPENIIIHKKTHNVSLVGLSFCIPEANTEKAKYQISNEIYTAPEVKNGLRVEPSTDIYSLGKIAIKLLGGNVYNNGMPVNVDERIRKFIQQMVAEKPSQRPSDAWKLWTEWRNLRTEVFGSQRFMELP